MSNYVNYGNFQGRRAAVQSVYYPAAKNASGPPQFQAGSAQAGFETDQHDAGIPQQNYGFTGANRAAPSSGAHGVVSASGAYSRPAQQQRYQGAPAPTAYAARGRSPAGPLAAVAPVAPAPVEATPAPYIESTYLAAGIPNQQFQLAAEQARSLQNSAAKAQAEAADQLSAFDAASESAIEAATAAYNDAINKVNEARARLSELGAARGGAPLAGFSFEASNPSGAGGYVAAVGTDASGKPQVYGVRFAEQAETIEAPATPAASGYQYKVAQYKVSSAPAKNQLAESVYFGMPNNLHYAAAQPQAYNVYSNQPAGRSLAAAAPSDSDVATAVLDSSNAGYAPSEAEYAASQGANQAASARHNPSPAAANSDYHLEGLRY